MLMASSGPPVVSRRTNTAAKRVAATATTHVGRFRNQGNWSPWSRREVAAVAIRPLCIRYRAESVRRKSLIEEPEQLHGEGLGRRDVGHVRLTLEDSNPRVR